MTRDLALRLASMREALGTVQPVVTGGIRRVVLFLSWTDGEQRAQVATVTGGTADSAWQRAAEKLAQEGGAARWLRIEWVDAVERSSWNALRERLKDVKRNYFRLGIALDAAFEQAFLETELNGNAMLYGGPREAAAMVNEANFNRYAAQRHGIERVDFDGKRDIWLFTTRGAFHAVGDDVQALSGKGLNAGRRSLPPLDADSSLQLIERGSRYLARQVGPDGRFRYGWHPCFNREIAAYNSLRHASSLYAMIEAWEVTRDKVLNAAIDRALAYLVEHLVDCGPLPGGEAAAFLVDSGGEIKLGGNALAILALVKYGQVTGDERHLALCEQLARTILYMQNDVSGRFVHVLNYPALDVKESFRTIYYDGEAAFALMRLFERTGDRRWLHAVENGFVHFMREEHWRTHDHWLSYCINELTRHDPSETYYQFGLDNVRDYLDFVLERITTFPTLLELMMAAARMIERIRDDPAHEHLLRDFDLNLFYRALHHRANYLLNGHFWPELAMFFARPDAIEGSFFIRHHAFRIRIDDVEHYLSGLVAYREFLLSTAAGHDHRPDGAEDRETTAFHHWTPDDVERATGGFWLRTPPSEWRATGLCIAPVTMRSGDMVVVRQAEGQVGVSVERLTGLPAPPTALIVPDNAAGSGASEERRPEQDDSRGPVVESEESEIVAADRQRAPAPPPAALGVDIPLLAVPNGGDAVLALGRYARARMQGKVLAVTGSAGKTTVVAMLAHALGAYGEVGQTRHNANLPHGIAWNLASIAWSVPHIVLELAIGRMARNARLARPDIAIFTNILPAHLEYHRDLATIAARKSAIFQGMSPGGVAILNRDMAEWEQVHMAARMHGLDVLHYGRSGEANFRLLSYDQASGRVKAAVFGAEYDYALGARGEHMALNSLATLAAVRAAGHEIEAALSALADFAPVAGRGADLHINLSGRQICLIDESYNANPGSMAAALTRVGAEYAARKIVVLGEMLELGTEEKTYHTALAPLISANKIDRVYLVGNLYDELWSALPEECRGGRAQALTDLQAALMADLQDGDLLMIKGSHGSAVHLLVEWLKMTADMIGDAKEKKGQAVPPTVGVSQTAQ
ncbi:Mur ligase family protein [Sphingopyxis sp. MWB1]|uniref:Mur ligase family protein n=1 Tax=Sphingopyxis sp. MWB1 TaxID=1537715 RepID=UPI0009DE50BC|nr:Mur ligase family protein [Sphingopyxis sp. MWB1]